MTNELTELSTPIKKVSGSTGHETLPSSEYRHPIPEWEGEEVHLRDYLDVIFRRKWIIISFLSFIFITTLIWSLSSTKIYRASASIEVSPQDQKVTSFEEVMTSELRAEEFYQTHVELLQNQALALRVIEKLDLASHPVVKALLFSDEAQGPASRSKGMFTSWLANLTAKLKTNDQNAPDTPPSVDEKALKQQALLEFLSDNLEISPSRNSMIIKIEFISPDRHLSQQTVNAFTEEFVGWNMEKKLEASRLAREFLMKQIDRAKIDLEKAEEELNRFAKQSGIVSLDSKLNSVYRQLEELNSALAEAEADLIGKAAAHQQSIKDGPSHLPQVMESQVIGNLKAEYVRIRSEYDDMSVTFHDEYPAAKALKKRMNGIAQRISSEEEKIALAIQNQYHVALKKVQRLRNRVDQQKQLAIDLNERATQYKIMVREVDTNKGIYQSLLQRTKEIESMVGVSSSNIHIVDQALLPIQPFKPKVKTNLLLAIAVGLLGGIGLAFFMEYFADTITNPDEITDRFQIPVLGVVPLVKTHESLVEQTFTTDPRAPLSEAMRTTKVSIQLSGSDSQAQSFLLTSTKPAEGKTTLAVNLAQAFASGGEKVVLVEADMRKPRLQKIFSTQAESSSPGLSSFLAGVGSKGLVCHNGLDNFCFVPAGPMPPNPVELLASNRFAYLMKALTRRFDRVILDGPPHQGFADTLILSQHVGGVILVSCMGETSRDALRHFIKSVLNVRATILGCIINKVNLNKRYGYQSYYKYYNYYSYYGKDKDVDANNVQKQITGKTSWLHKVQRAIGHTSSHN